VSVKAQLLVISSPLNLVAVSEDPFPGRIATEVDRPNAHYTFGKSRLTAAGVHD
jgi:hypothetical protein